ncbi:MAG: HEPN domain-containing protein [Candidatus Aenigmarchaeota archaeon]|nr:HEPN domain-containing protein [Candidatus Aenigmarchaeota archaeon]
MKKQSFLSKLKEDGKLELVEASEEICSSYLEKADNCLKSAKILLKNELYENSISMSYYAMYNSLTALLFKTGIKCENHSASILLLKKVFNKIDLFKKISSTKEERIDKQYYLTSKENLELTKESTKDMINEAENFLIQIKLFINKLCIEEIENIRKRFKSLVPPI